MSVVGAMMRDLGGLMAAVRSQAGLRQEDLADKLGLTQAGVSSRERGKAGVPHEEIERFVRATGVPLVVTPSGWDVYDLPVPAFPCYGKVPCGHPILIDDPPESEVHLADLTGGLWREGRHYLLIADGESMRDAGILDGDWLVVERREAKLGNIVVATVNGGTTVKRLARDPDTDDLVLVPAHPGYEKRQITEFDECQVQGVVVRRIRCTEVG